MIEDYQPVDQEKPEEFSVHITVKLMYPEKIYIECYTFTLYAPHKNPPG